MVLRSHDGVPSDQLVTGVPSDVLVTVVRRMNCDGCAMSRHVPRRNRSPEINIDIHLTLANNDAESALSGVVVYRIFCFTCLRLVMFIVLLVPVAIN